MDDRTGEQDQHSSALLQLHVLAKTFGDLDPGEVPGFRRLPAADALAAVAEADHDDVSVAGRLHLLHNLAKADFPHHDRARAGYEALAGSIADARDLDADQLLSDLKESATERVPFQQTSSGQALPHRDVAFIGEDVCTTRLVQVGGLLAAWVFSELETDAPFGKVAEWVDPRNWPERGPMMFKRMDLVGSPDPIGIDSLSNQHWHGVFHEEVQLVKRVNTLLHCDYWRGDKAAGMTYDLDLSLDGEIDVDRGFLSVEDLGDVRRVRALKIVGFTDDAWDEVAQMVCPFWTDWVRGAVEGGTDSQAGTSPGSTSGKPHTPGADALDAWVRFFGESARTYLDLFVDIGGRATARGATPADWVAEGNRYWSQLAKDWARAWTYGLEALEEVAREGLDAGLTPPGTDPASGRGVASAVTAAATRATAPGRPVAGESTTVPVPGLAAGDAVECSRLVSLESGGATIPEVSLTVEPLGGGRYGVRVGTTDTTLPAGLYVGTLQTPGGRVLAPVQLYLARTREADQA
jgi:hypothetical protein